MSAEAFARNFAPGEIVRYPDSDIVVIDKRFNAGFPRLRVGGEDRPRFLYEVQ